MGTERGGKDYTQSKRALVLEGKKVYPTRAVAFDSNLAQQVYGLYSMVKGQ